MHQSCIFRTKKAVAKHFVSQRLSFLYVCQRLKFQDIAEKEHEHQSTQRDAVPAKGLKVVLLHELHEPADCGDRDDKRDRHAQNEHRDLKRCKAAREPRFILRHFLQIFLKWHTKIDDREPPPHFPRQQTETGPSPRMAGRGRFFYGSRMFYWQLTVKSLYVFPSILQ